jgi:putative PEP-CTERM system TPR-repeat lipoprotein
MQNRKCLLILSLLLALAGCSRNPEAVKRRYFEAGNKYFTEGKLKEASIMYRNAIKHDQRFGDAYWKLGEVELRRGEVSEALRALRRAVELLPSNPEPASKLAEIYIGAYSSQGARADKRLLDEARDIADTMVKRDPNSFLGLRLKGFLASVNGDLKGAIEYLRKADAAKPDDPSLRLGLAQLLTATDQFAEGETIAKGLIEKQKDYQPSYDFLIQQYVRRNRMADAEAIINRRVQNFPKESAYRVQQAAFLYSTQRRPQGEQILQDMVNNSKDFPDARMVVGDFYMRTREWTKAYDQFQQGANQNNAKLKSSYKIKMALTLIAQGDRTKLTDALAISEQVLKEDPKNDDALQLHAALILQVGDAKQKQQAINDLQAMLSRTPNNHSLHYNLGRAYQLRGDYDAAKVQYQEAIKLRPNFVAAQIGLGNVMLAKGDSARALQTASDILRIDPQNLSGQLIRAAALVNTGDFKEARNSLETALKLRPDEPNLRYQMAILDARDQKYKEAEDAFKKLQVSYPGDPRLLAALTDIGLATGRGDATLQLLEQELQKYPDRQDIHLLLAAVAIRTNKVDMAVAEYRKLIEKNPKSFDLYMRLGDALRVKGDTKGSIDALRTGQTLAPTNPAANLQLALTLESSGQRNDARPFYETVLKSQPDNPVALNNLAYALAEEGKDLDQALTYAQRAKQKLPNSDDVADTLGWIYIKKNLSDNAIQIFRGLVNKQPKNATFHYHLGMALYQKGDKVKAKQSLQTALTFKPSADEEAKIKELLAKAG